MKTLKMKLRELKKREKIVNRKDWVFVANKHICNFQQFETIRSFAKKIDADEDQSNLLAEIMNFKKNTKPKNQEGKKSICNL